MHTCLSTCGLTSTNRKCSPRSFPEKMASTVISLVDAPSLEKLWWILSTFCAFSLGTVRLQYYGISETRTRESFHVLRVTARYPCPSVLKTLTLSLCWISTANAKMRDNVESESNRNLLCSLSSPNTVLENVKCLYPLLLSCAVREVIAVPLRVQYYDGGSTL